VDALGTVRSALAGVPRERGRDERVRRGSRCGVLTHGDLRRTPADAGSGDEGRIEARTEDIRHADRFADVRRARRR
jgi:hypothetical protein